MSTRKLSRISRGVALALSLGTVATASAQQLPVPPTFSLQGGEHLQVISGYLRDEPGTIVRGFVRRDPLWQVPVRGHLHITGFAATGEVIAEQITTWSGRFAGSHGPPLAYRADLKVARADLARVTVAFVGGRHSSSESFQ